MFKYYKIKNWVDTFMQIPFNRINNLPLTIEDGVDKCHTFMEDAKHTLDYDEFIKMWKVIASRF